MPLQNKIALVTGASRGIGQAIALCLSQAGACVIGTATKQEGADAITTMFEQAGLSGRGEVLNVTQPEAVATLLQSVNEVSGPIDILVNNAGVTQDNLLLRMDDEEWQQVIDTNLTAVYRLSRACLRAMMKKRWGRIVNISSVVATTGNAGQCNYAAAKAGMQGFSKSLALEVASRNITVNVVAPGFIATDMTKTLPDIYQQELLKRIPMKRMGQPEDVANAVVFLVSEQASYMTGQTIHINGGMFLA